MQVKGSTAPCASRSQLVLNERKLQHVKIILKEQQKNTGQHENQIKFLTEEERTIGTAPSVDSFNCWAETCRDVKCDRCIVIRHLTTVAHSACEEELFFQLNAQGLHAQPSPSMVGRINGNTLQPDVVVVVRGNSTRVGGTRPGATRFAVLVIEVACTQNPKDLHSRGALFLGLEYPSVEFYIGFQRYELCKDGSQAMVAAVYTRANAGVAPISMTSFETAPLAAQSWWDMQKGVPGFPQYAGVGYGGGPCNGPGIPMYILQFPSATLYSTHPAGVPLGAPVAYTVDLHAIQTAFGETVDL